MLPHLTIQKSIANNNHDNKIISILFQSQSLSQVFNFFFNSVALRKEELLHNPEKLFLIVKKKILTFNFPAKALDQI